MKKKYKDTPDNLSEIVPYIIMDSKQAGSEIIEAEKCYFYDACSFRKHMVMPHPEYLFSYIKQTKGIVVITRCIMMELCSNDNQLWQKHINYIRRMGSAGIKVLVIFEEDIFEAESMCFSSTSEINKHLSIAIKTVKSKVGTVEATLMLDSALRDSIFTSNISGVKTKYSEFFTKVRANKESEDNLGEELIIICLHILSNILETNKHKYIIFTEDKGAISQLGRAKKNIEEYLNRKSIAAITIPKLAQLLFEESIITDKSQVEEVLLAGNMDTNIRVLCSEKFDMSSTLKTMSCGELAEKIINIGSIHVNY